MYFAINTVLNQMKSNIQLTYVDGFITHWSSIYINLQDHCQISTSFYATLNNILYCWYTKAGYHKIIYPYLLTEALNTHIQSMTYGIIFPWYYFSLNFISRNYFSPFSLTSFQPHSSGTIPRAKSMPGVQSRKIISSGVLLKSRPRDETQVQREAHDLY